jgi:crotonobetainyl-CoA:carnitine CoA-transferase CaiB-like acyl-CoA transferase
MLPLDGMLVLDFSQFLAGPSCALRLADLGAQVVKVERRNGGDNCRQLFLADMAIDDDSALFHTINRNKGSIAVDLKSAEDLAAVKRLLAKADVMIQNFRPGVIERLGLGYEAVAALNPGIVYGSISGYGASGPWRDLPGQDLLVQSLSGLTWMNGNAADPPVPVGVSIADIVTGAHLCQGLLAALLRKARTGKGALVEVSLMESILDVQFEGLTHFVSGDQKQPQRSTISNGYVYHGGPYGLFATCDGYLAVAMNPVDKLGELIGSSALAAMSDRAAWFTRRDEIKGLLTEVLAGRSTEAWLAILQPADIWCAPVLDWVALTRHPGFAALDMLQTTLTQAGTPLVTTRCPIRIDGQILKHERGGPALGEDNYLLNPLQERTA